jgi:hypothetical protein
MEEAQEHLTRAYSSIQQDASYCSQHLNRATVLHAVAHALLDVLRKETNHASDQAPEEGNHLGQCEADQE